MQLVEEKWSEILLTVKREHELTDISFNTWLKPLQIFSIQNNRIFVLVSSEQMGLTYISKKYYLPLKVAVAEITGMEYEIEFVKDYIEYEAEIDARTGVFYKWEIDRD